MLLLGLVGGVAIASVAGARRTASTFAGYEREVRLSHLAVNTSGRDLERVAAIAALPGVESSATYVGLNANPVVDDVEVFDFRYTGTFGSLDGRFFAKDRATVMDGRLPALDAIDEIALTPGQAAFAHVGVGAEITYQFRDYASGAELDRQRYRVVGIVQLPPVLVDENDIIQGAILPPAATKAHLDAAYYAWQGIRLVGGLDGISAFLDSLESDPVARREPPVVQRYDEVRSKVQRAVRPQAVALALFGAAAGLAALALGAQGVSRLLARWSGDAPTLRALGFTRRQVTVVAALDAALAVLAGAVLAVVVAWALSPLSPFGSVRTIAPDTGAQADWTAFLGGSVVLVAPLLAAAALLGRRLAPATDRRPSRRPPVVVEGAARAGLPLPMVLGAGFAVRPPGNREAVPARVSLAGTAIAMIAVVAALVFGSSLSALVSHPERFGWNWDQLLIAQAGYGSLDPTLVTALVESERDITGWSMLSFEQLTIDGVPVPTLGIDRRRGAVEPPTVAGRPVTGPGDIALGVTTLSQIGKRVGDTVRVAQGDRTLELEVVGSVTFPAIGVGGGDQTSLGRGALLTFAALAPIVSPAVDCPGPEGSDCPNAIAFDVAPGADGGAVASRIAAVDPDGTPGGTYSQPVSRPADVRNYDQMRSQPVALASLLAGASLVALLVALLASVRARRRDFAVLKALGASGGQLRAAVATQAIAIVGAATAVGLPLGVVTGRVSWIRFARSVGVVPVSEVPFASLIGVAAVVAVLCSFMAMVPATLAARTPASQALRTE